MTVCGGGFGGVFGGIAESSRVFPTAFAGIVSPFSVASEDLRLHEARKSLEISIIHSKCP